jgi:regulator of protease activity HflC (stomatin/prohibitin superfamily)
MRGIVFLYRALHRQILAAAMRVAVISLYLMLMFGQNQFDDLLSKRDDINAELQRIIGQQTEPWGVTVTAVEVKNVAIPQDMQRAIARQAEAERERRAKIIYAEGEFQAAQKLAEAADIISRNPTALQLRYLQTLVEIAAEKNSPTIFQIRINTLAPCIKRLLPK